MERHSVDAARNRAAAQDGPRDGLRRVPRRDGFIRWDDLSGRIQRRNSRVEWRGVDPARRHRTLRPVQTRDGIRHGAGPHDPVRRDFRQRRQLPRGHVGLGRLVMDPACDDGAFGKVRTCDDLRSVEAGDRSARRIRRHRLPGRHLGMERRRLGAPRAEWAACAGRPCSCVRCGPRRDRAVRWLQ